MSRLTNNLQSSEYIIFVIDILLNFTIITFKWFLEFVCDTMREFKKYGS